MLFQHVMCCSLPYVHDFTTNPEPTQKELRGLPGPGPGRKNKINYNKHLLRPFIRFIQNRILGGVGFNKM